MPTYKIQDPQTGLTVELEGDAPPTETELIEIFAQLSNGRQDSPLAQQVPIDAPAIPGVDEDVPTPENLAIQPQQQPEPTLGQQAIGGLETLGALATGATGGALGFAGGSIAGALGELTGQLPEGQGEQLAQEAAAALTFEPRTEAGREMVSDISELLSQLPAFVGASPFQAATAGARVAGGVGRLPKKAKIAAQNLSKTKRALAEEIKAGNRDAGNIAMALDADGALIKNKNVKRAIQLMGNDEAAYSTALNFEKMNPATRSQINKMLDVIESNKVSGDPVGIMNNRPANVIGESLARRARKLDDIRRSAGKELDEAIKGELGGKQLNISQPVNKFISDLQEAGVKISRDESGKIVANSSESLINFGEVLNDKRLGAVLNRIESGVIDGKTAHQLKRQLRESVSFDAAKVGAAKVSGEAENAIKQFTAGLNDELGRNSAKYRKANQKFSDVIGALKKADDAVGNKLLIGDELAESKLGSMAKRIGTNLASKEAVLDMVDSLDEALNKRGFRPKDDIRRQVAALADLEKIFKVEQAQAPFGFQSRVAQGALDAATGQPIGVTREAANFVLDKFRSMSELEFNDKMKALRKLSEVRK